MSLIKLGMIFFTIFNSAYVCAEENPKILFIRKEGRGFDDVYAVMKKDLEKKFEVTDFIVEKGTAYPDVRERLAKENPRLMVLMDNKSVGFGLKYNAEQTDAKKKVRGVALMALNLPSLLKGNKEISGIAYESPAYTLVTQFRYLQKVPLKTVVVFYRKSLFEETIKAAEKQLEKEKIKLVAIDVEKQGKEQEKTKLELIEGFSKNVGAPGQEKCDVVWVMLDSGLINQSNFSDVWIKNAQSAKIPFLSGSEDFVAKDLNFVTFAVTPNLPDLANQAVQQVEAAIKDNVAASDAGVEDLISVNKFLNMKRVNEIGMQIKESNLTEVKLID